MKYNIKTGICANCGADEGLHHYDSERCPKNGIEEWRKGKVQQWENTRFEDSGIKAYEEKAISEYDKLKAVNDCYKINNEILVNALTDILDLFPEKPNLAISHKVIELASDALEKTDNYGK